MICDHSDYRLSICKRLGFAVCNNKEDVKLSGLTGILGTAAGVNGTALDCDIWIDAAGADAVLSDYEKYGKYNSRLVMVAVGSSHREMDILGLTFGQKAVIGSGGYSPQDVLDVMEIMKSGRWDIEALITHEFSLTELDKAIEQAADVERALNVIIHFDEEA